MSTALVNFTAIDAQVASAATAVVDAGDSETVQIFSALLYNTTGGAVTVTFHRDTTGETPAGANVVATAAVAGTTHATVPGLANLILNAGESLFASDGTGAQVNINISGKRITG